MPEIVIDQDLCTRCGACLALCKGPVYKRIDDKIQAAAPEACWLCGHCIAACPNDAIRHSEFPLDECPVLDPAGLPSLDELVAAFRERRSLRVFKNKPVPREIIQSLVDVARWVPSASNKQPVDWLAFDDPARIAALSARAIAAFAQAGRLLRNPLFYLGRRLAVGAAIAEQERQRADRLEAMAQEMEQGYDPIFFHAPVVLVAHVPMDDYFGRDDAIYATYNLILAAQRLGLGACQIGYFIRALGLDRRLSDELGLPPGRRVQVALALGYPQYRFRRVIPRRRPGLVFGTA